MKLLGAPVREFKYSLKIAIIFGLCSVVFTGAMIASVVTGGLEWWIYAIFIGFMLGSIAGLVWIMSCIVTIYETGLAYKNRLSQSEMTWDEVEKFRYAIVTIYHKGIIPQTIHTIVLVDQQGHKLNLGSVVAKPEALGKLLWEKLAERLMQKMSAAYDAGKTLDMGYVKIFREYVQISTGLSTKKILNATVAGAAIANGKFYVSEKKDGKIKQHEVSLMYVDNAFPLQELISSRIVQQVRGVGAQ